MYEISGRIIAVNIYKFGEKILYACGNYYTPDEAAVIKYAFGLGDDVAGVQWVE